MISFLVNLSFNERTLHCALKNRKKSIAGLTKVLKSLHPQIPSERPPCLKKNQKALILTFEVVTQQYRFHFFGFCLLPTGKPAAGEPSPVWPQASEARLHGLFNQRRRRRRRKLFKNKRFLLDKMKHMKFVLILGQSRNSHIFNIIGFLYLSIFKGIIFVIFIIN